MINYIHKQKLHLLTVIILPVLFSLLSGCSTVQIGRDFDIEAFEEIVGMADMSKAQVKELLGVPKGKGIAVEEDGKRLDEWLYFFGSGKLPDMSDTTIKTLQIRFDKKGIVRSYNWSYSK